MSDSMKIGSTGGASGDLGGATKNSAKNLSKEFMSLFLAQLKTQDPTAPMKNTEMVSQLAQLSSVEQLERSNQMAQLQVQAAQTQTNAQLIGLRGSEAVFSTNEIHWGANATNISGTIKSDSASPQKLTITNSNGIVVKEMTVKPDENGKLSWDWDGRDTYNRKVTGTFSITAVSEANKKPSVVETKGVVDSIGYLPTPHAVLAGGAQMEIKDMTAVLSKK